MFEQSIELRQERAEEMSSRRSRRWGVLLAGGDGTRLHELTRLIYGDERPKQFCSLFGEESLLVETRIRAERSIAGEQILVPLTTSHRAFYLREAGILPSQRIVQPANRGTAPPILHGLRSIARQDHEALVAVLPCDHHYLDEPAFTAALECAFSIAAEHTNSVVLLGAPPESPEVDYGWIALGPSINGSAGAGFCVPGPGKKPSLRSAFRVRGFFEKPLLRTAGKLLARGALWNTFVTVGHVGAFLEIMNVALSNFAKCLRTDQLWSGSEVHIPDSLYKNLPSVDFSRDVLSVQAQRLVVSRMGETGWSDLGQPKRVLAAIRRAGLEPWWTKKLPQRRMAEDGRCPSFARFRSS